MKKLKKPTVMMLALDAIEPSAMNPRRRFDAASLAELAASLTAHGMLHPAVVRPAADDHRFELLAGRRRYEAARIAGLPQIPCSVIDCDDAAAMDICVTENLQREQLNPVEEARGVRMLLDSGRSVDDVADKLGKSSQWVRRRNAIADLIAEIAAEVERGTRPEGTEDCEDYDVPGWFQAPAAVLELCARLPQDVQRRLWECYHIGDSVSTFGDDVSRALQVIEDAPWYDSDAEPNGHKEMCEQCSKRTDAQRELFPELAKDAARCLDSECWDDRQASWVARLALDVAQKHGIEESQVRVVATDEDARLYYDTTVRADPEDEGAMPYIRRGEVEWRLPREAVQDHYKAPSGPSEEALRRARWASLVRDAVGKLDGSMLTDDEIMCLAATFGAYQHGAGEWSEYDDHVAAQDGRKPTARWALWTKVRGALANTAYIPPWMADTSAEFSRVNRLCEVLHLDADALWTESANNEEEQA